MATKSKVVEGSFRLGAGRYIQEDGAVLRLAEEIKMLGCKKPYIIHGKRAMAVAVEKIEKSLNDGNIGAVFFEYTEFCNPELCNRIIASPEFAICDCVVGVGGGNVCDASKLCGARAGLPVITVPTSSATCAAYTPLSVCYNSEGQTIGTIHHKCEVNCILADMEILCRQPLRLLVAGVYDSLAKMLEIKQRLDGKSEDEIDIGLRSSYVLSEFMYERLLSDLPKASEDVVNGENTKALFDTVYLTVAVTGVISGLARGSNQTAIAHKIYETSRSLFPHESHSSLHGELVAIGLISQLIYNGEPQKAEIFKNQMRSLGMPTSLSEAGLEMTADNIKSFTEKIEKSSALAGCSEEEILKFRQAFEVISRS